mgnify:FL=1
MRNKKGLNASQMVGIIVLVAIISVATILQLTGKINLIKNQRDFCPGIGDRVLCGICNKDVVLSDNPHAGQCRMCPAGTHCSGDVCGEIKCIPGDDENLPIPVPLKDIPYTTKSGEELVAKSAFTGYVYVLTEDDKEEDAIKYFESNGGKVDSSIPDAGIYLVAVKEGTEGEFLSEAYKQEWVIDGMPVSPPSKGTISVHDFFSGNPVFTGNPKVDCDILHGNIVEIIASRFQASIERDELPLEIEEDPKFTVKMIKRIRERIIKANKDCENIVFSLSLQSFDSAWMESKQHSDCQEIDCQDVRNSQKIFYTMFLKMMNGLYKKNPTLLDNAIVVIIAGNAGVDIDKPISEVRNKYPEAFNHMLIVGGLYWGDEEEIILSFNHLRNNTLPGNSLHPSMVYAVANEVPVFDKNKQSMVECEGTSFAAPQVAAAVDYIWRKTPELTASQVMDSFDRAMYDKGNAGMIPRKRKGLDIFPSLDFLDYAVGLSKAKIPATSLTGLWEGDFTSKYISEEGWICITETNNPIRICMDQKCKNVKGVITFPEGLKGITTSPEEGAFCPPSIACKGGEGGQCSEFTGTFNGTEIKLEYFVLNGGSFLPNPYLADKVQSSAIFADNTTIFNFNSSGSSGANSRSLTTGRFKTKKVAYECTT